MQQNDKNRNKIRLQSDDIKDAFVTCFQGEQDSEANN